jgi:hypothetical protein
MIRVSTSTTTSVSVILKILNDVGLVRISEEFGAFSAISSLFSVGVPHSFFPDSHDILKVKVL